MLAAHGAFDNDLLQRQPTVLVDRFGAKCVALAEPVLQLFQRVMFALAPGAVGGGAGRVAQLADQAAGLGKLVAHPGRHHRIAAGDRQPGQRVGQRPGAVCGSGDDLAAGCRAAFFIQEAGDGSAGFVGTRGGAVAGDHEKPVQAGNGLITGGQPVPGKQQIGGSLLHLLQASLLVAKHLQGQFGIEQRIILAVAQQLPVLVVLDEMVVGVFREGQRVEAQGIDSWLGEQPQVGVGGAQLRQIEGDQIVAEQKGCVVSQRIKLIQRFREFAWWKA